MSNRTERLTENQLKILKAMEAITETPGEPVRPVNIGAFYGIERRNAPKWACSGLVWLCHYGIVEKLGKGLYRITPNGYYYLNNFT